MTSLLLYAIYTNSFTCCEGGGLVSVKKVQRIIVYCCVLPCNCVLPFCREFFHALVCFTFQSPTEMISPAQQALGSSGRKRERAREKETRECNNGSYCKRFSQHCKVALLPEFPITLSPIEIS